LLGYDHAYESYCKDHDKAGDVTFQIKLHEDAANIREGTHGDQQDNGRPKGTPPLGKGLCQACPLGDFRGMGKYPNYGQQQDKQADPTGPPVLVFPQIRPINLPVSIAH